MNLTNEVKELQRQYEQFCNNCPKAYDFTCSGADAKACEEQIEQIKKKDKEKRIFADAYDINEFVVDD